MPAETRVKICGLTAGPDRDAAIDAGADALGFIVDVPVETPRELAPERAAELIAGAPPFVSTVLVTMADTADRVADLLAVTGADAVQLHGGPAPELVRTVAAATDARVIAATEVDDAAGARAYADAADAVLVDSADDAGGGGTGEPHDWDRTRSLRAALDAPVVLAGGLTPENVGRGVRTVAPYAVDVASGVERPDAPGRKDHDAVARFVATVRRARGRGSEAPA